MTVLTGQVTKKALTEAVQALVARTPDETPLHGEDLAFMIELFQRHPLWPEKQGRGVRSVVVRLNTKFGYRPTRGFWLVRTDGTEVDISWREAVSPTPHHRKVKAALRHLVADQSVAYRRGRLALLRRISDTEPACCEACGDSSPGDAMEVDHMPPQEFDILVSEFMTHRGLLFSDIDLCKHGERDLGDSLRDEKLAADWREWHRERAQLWLVCAPCHKRLTANRKRKEADGNNP